MKRGVFCMLGLLLIVAFSCKKDAKSIIPDGTMGTVTDVEGNVYKTVKIGGQWWMAENLKTHKLNDAQQTPIPTVIDPSTWANNTVPMLCYYDNDDVNNKDKYGALYNWYAVNTGKLAPEGWHVPSDAEWQELKNYLISHGYNYDGTKVENLIGKSLASVSGWINSDLIGNVGNDQASNNKSGFNGLPAGFRDQAGNFIDNGSHAKWWTTIESSSNFAYLAGLNSNFSKLFTGSNNDKKYGFSIRCVKD